MKKETYYLLCDFETTGTQDDAVPLELCAQILDNNYEPVTSEMLWTFEAPSLEHGPPWSDSAYRLHLRSGLMEELRSDDPIEHKHSSCSEALLALWCGSKASGHRMILTGCSPQFDRRFLKRTAPKFVDLALTHQHHDVSTILAFLRTCGLGEGIAEMERDLGPVKHRALADVQRERRQLQAMRDLMRVDSSLTCLAELGDAYRKKPSGKQTQKKKKASKSLPASDKTSTKEVLIKSALQAAQDRSTESDQPNDAWLTSRQISNSLRLSKSSVDYVLRQLCGQGSVRVLRTPKHAANRVPPNVYALADTPDPSWEEPTLPPSPPSNPVPSSESPKPSDPVVDDEVEVQPSDQTEADEVVSAEVVEAKPKALEPTSQACLIPDGDLCNADRLALVLSSGAASEIALANALHTTSQRVLLDLGELRKYGGVRKVEGGWELVAACLGAHEIRFQPKDAQLVWKAIQASPKNPTLEFLSASTGRSERVVKEACGRLARLGFLKGDSVRVEVQV